MPDQLRPKADADDRPVHQRLERVRVDDVGIELAYAATQNPAVTKGSDDGAEGQSSRHDRISMQIVRASVERDDLDRNAGVAEKPNEVAVLCQEDRR